MYGFVRGRFRYDKILFCIPKFFIIGDTFNPDGSIINDYVHDSPITRDNYQLSNQHPAINQGVQ